jgi:diacylglycerol kinase family enzyme
MAARVCVIYNPSAGRGRGRGRLERLHRVLEGQAEFRPTDAVGQAEKLAFQAAQQEFSIVAAAGGDGTVHEVANGMLRASRPEVTLAVIPVGSANDYAYSLGLDANWWLRPDPAVRPQRVDVGRVRSGPRERYFVNGLGLGLNGAVTLESRRIRRLQGLALYGLALFRALYYHYRSPLMVVQLDGHEARVVPTLALSIALGQREGNFVIAPDARLDDGWFDYLHVGALPRHQLVTFLPGLFAGRLRPSHPAVWTGRCRQVSVRSEAPLTVHLDGEFFCRPEDEVCDLEAELLPGALQVFARSSPSGGAGEVNQFRC